MYGSACRHIRQYCRCRQSTITPNCITTTLKYNDPSLPIGESYSGGTLTGLYVTNIYDSYLRRTQSASKTTGGGTLSTASYGYDNASWLQSVSDGTHSATYSYVANSPLVSQIAFNNAANRMTTSKQYDKLNRLTSILSTPSGTNQLPVSFAYAYNAANQRYRVTLTDGSYWFYEYDTLGQLRSGKKYWSDGTPVAGQQFEYTHDDIGNRMQTKAGGDASGVGLRPATYTANSLNQYSSRTVAYALDILGIAPANASVTVNSSPADYRRGEYFQELVTVANGANPVWQSVSVTTSGGGSDSGNVFVPKTPENFGYDLDGNMTNDGRWAFTWDAENRLVKLESLASGPSGSKRRLEFEYDWQGRRIKKKVTNLDTGSVLLDNKFLYDLPTARLPAGQGQAGGWNLVAELNATNNAVIRSYMWGPDLSGTRQGAGGVGGLLAVNDAANGVHFVAFDGNGNVAALVKATDGTVSAQYEYGPFAEPIRLTGVMGKVNPLRFSTKYTDDESGFLYYGRRFYDPSTGRWLSRDPRNEAGGFNLYSSCANNLVIGFDSLGMFGMIPPGTSFTTCKLQLDFDLTSPTEHQSWFDRTFRQPHAIKYVNNSKNILDEVNRRIPKYDPDGNCCKGACIEHFTLSAHGEGPGVIPLSNVDPGSIEKELYHSQNAWMADTTKQLTPVMVRLRDQLLKANSVMLSIKSKMCKQSKISFIVCYAGQGVFGEDLRSQLSQLFGPGIEVEIFSGGCGYIYGEPWPE